MIATTLWLSHPNLHGLAWNVDLIYFVPSWKDGCQEPNGSKQYNRLWWVVPTDSTKPTKRLSTWKSVKTLVHNLLFNYTRSQNNDLPREQHHVDGQIPVSWAHPGSGGAIYVNNNDYPPLVYSNVTSRHNRRLSILWAWKMSILTWFYLKISFDNVWFGRGIARKTTEVCDIGRRSFRKGEKLFNLIWQQLLFVAFPVSDLL